MKQLYIELVNKLKGSNTGFKLRFVVIVRQISAMIEIKAQCIYFFEV